MVHVSSILSSTIRSASRTSTLKRNKFRVSSMLSSTIIRSASTATTTASSSSSQLQRKTFRSLALAVYFKHPDLFDMKQYEMLSRATAFLLAVDPPDAKDNGDAFSHLELAEHKRQIKHFRREHGFTPASAGGTMMDMGWLEFLPREHRPQVHIVTSSHVLAPYLWSEYYPQDWLQHIKPEHCKYELEVYDAPGNSILTLDVQGKPFHHPEGRDVALCHFHDEAKVLPVLKQVGVEILHLRDDESQYELGEEVSFEGYAVTDDKHANVPKPLKSGENQPKEGEEDTRVFYPHNEVGKLAFHQKDRFFATTPAPLPEGLCGAPALTKETGRCTGVVEGIVPVSHDDKRIAGAACFMPHFYLDQFIDYVERHMLEAVMEPHMFQMVVTAKKTNSIGGGVYKLKDDGSYGADTNFDEAFDIMIKNMKKSCSKEEMDAFMNILEDEKKQILKIMETEKDADMSEVANRVRARTLATRDLVHKQFKSMYQKMQQQQQQQQQQEGSSGNDSSAS